MGLETLSFSCTHWALGSLVLIGLASSEFSGAGSLVALPIVAIAINLSALCGSPSSSEFAVRRKKCGHVLEFLVIWTDILEHIASAATCARVVSATVDYTTRGRLREWLFGIESHSLGEPWPDVLGVTIIIVVTTLFMLGLERSLTFSIILFVGVLSSFLFFITVGGYHTDIQFWNWTEDFELRKWSCVITTAAMCSFGFANKYPDFGEKYRRLKCLAFVLVPLICYSLTATIFTLMSHYSELAGTAIPLMRIFEVRDVDWARPVMAVFTVSVVSVALTEIFPSLCDLIILLSGNEWQVLVTSLLYKNSVTGAPMLALFIAGSLTCILAFACPLAYLVCLLNISPLIKCTLRTTKVLYDRFKPEFANETYSGNTNIHYSKLNQGQVKTKISATPRFKAVFDALPNYLGGSSSKTNIDRNDMKNRRVVLGITEDKEYLLLGDYSNNAEEFSANLNSGTSDSEEEIDPRQFSENEESSSSTDVDAAVQEYKERIHVATVNNFSEHRTPSILSSLIVIVSILIILVSSVAFAVGVIIDCRYLIWPGVSAITLVLIIILVMPQNINERARSNLLPPSLFPVSAVISISLSVILTCTLLQEIWPGLLFWTLTGLILFWRCDCCTCEGLMLADKTKLTKKDYGFQEVQIDKHVDTILIAR